MCLRSHVKQWPNNSRFLFLRTVSTGLMWPSILISSFLIWFNLDSFCSRQSQHNISAELSLLSLIRPSIHNRNWCIDRFEDCLSTLRHTPILPTAHFIQPILILLLASIKTNSEHGKWLDTNNNISFQTSTNHYVINQLKVNVIQRVSRSQSSS